MIREALKLAALAALRGVLLKFVLPLLVVIILVGGLIGGIVAAIFGGTGTAASAGDCTVSGGTGGKKTAVHASQVEIAKAIDEGIRELGFSGKVSRLTIIAAIFGFILSSRVPQLSCCWRIPMLVATVPSGLMAPSP